MSQVAVIGLLSATTITAYLLSLTSVSVFLPQLIALLSLLFIIFNKYKLPLIFLVSTIVSLIIFTTGSLNSPLFFLVYFLLFITAFQYSPTTSLSFSLIIVLLLSQSLNSLESLIPLASLVFITPIAWFISHQTQSAVKTEKAVEIDETDFLFWLNLKFKSSLNSIIDETKQPSPDLKKIQQSAKNLLNSSEKLSQEIDDNSDEI